MTDRPQKTVQKKTIKHKSKRSKRGGSNVLIYSFVTMMLISIMVVLSLTVFFKVSDITVSGKSEHYSSEQITTASGIFVGNNLFLIDADSAENRIKSQLPYVTDVTVEKKFPSSIVINIKEKGPDRVYNLNGKYALAVGEKIMEIVDEYPEGYIYYNIPVKQADEGSNVKLDSEIKEVYTALGKAISESGLENITAISFTGKVDIKLIYDNRLLLEVGTTENIKEKLASAEQVINSVTTKYGDQIEGTINLKYLVDDSTETYFTQEEISQYGITPQKEMKETSNAEKSKR